jgi:hypothetical protein
MPCFQGIRCGLAHGSEHLRARANLSVRSLNTDWTSHLVVAFDTTNIDDKRGFVHHLARRSTILQGVC